MIKPKKYSYMTDEDWEIFYSDCLNSHGITPETLDGIIELIQKDMRDRGVSEEIHRIGRCEILIKI